MTDEFPLPASARTDADVQAELDERCARATAYTAKIVVDADGYPQMTSAGTLWTLLANAFLAGIVSEAGEIRAAGTPSASARTVTRYKAVISPAGFDPNIADERDAEVYLASEVDAQFAEAELILQLYDALLTKANDLEDEVARLRASRDEYKALASVGAWHKDCRPNRKKAAEEIQKSQQRIDTLATALADHAQAVQTLASDLRALIDPKKDPNLTDLLAVADRLDALAGRETP